MSEVGRGLLDGSGCFCCLHGRLAQNSRASSRDWALRHNLGLTCDPVGGTGPGSLYREKWSGEQSRR